MRPRESTRPHGYSETGRGPFRALLVATVISVAGGAVSVVALPWFVLATTNSTVLTGLASVCETVPLIAGSFAAGAVVARFGALWTRLGSDAISALSVLAIPLLYATVGIAYWQILLLVTVNGSMRAPAPAATLVLLRQVAAAGRIDTARASSRYFAVNTIAGAAGAPLGGVLIATAGAPSALLADATSFALSALILTAACRTRPPGGDHQARSAGAPVKAWTGLSALAHDGVLAGLCSLFVASALIRGAWNSVLAPLYGRQILHSATALGVLFGALGVGAMIGNLTYPWLSERLSSYRLIWVCLAAEGTLRFGSLAATSSVPILAAAVMVAGVGLGVLSPLWLRLLTNRVSAERHGHVFGVTFGLEQAGVALGALVGGSILAAVSLHATLIAITAITAALTVAAAAGRPFRTLPG